MTPKKNSASIESHITKEPSPSSSARFYYAVPLFLLFLVLAVFLRLSDQFNEMFVEMNLGRLPRLTEYSLYLAAWFKAAPWCFPAGMFLLTWIHFVFAARKRKYLEFSRTLTIVLLLGAGTMCPVSLFMPLLEISKPCLVKGTLVLTPGGSVPIEDLQIGQFVFTRDVNGHMEQGKIIACFQFNTESHLNIRLRSGEILRATSEHPILTEEGFKCAGALTSEDYVGTSEGYGQIEAIKIIRGPVSVHDLSVEPNHTYLANGIWVHNKIGQ